MGIIAIARDFIIDGRVGGEKKNSLQTQPFQFETKRINRDRSRYRTQVDYQLFVYTNHVIYGPLYSFSA